MESDHDKMARMVEERKRALQEANKLESSIRLKENMKKRIKTTMIGAISAIEDEMGHLWGINRREEELTEDEIELRDLWEKARMEILNKGNRQIRISEEEIAQYTIYWNKYYTEFKNNLKRG